MAESAGGTGAANDAAIVAEDGTPATPEEAEQSRLEKGRAEGRAALIEAGQRAVEAAEASLEKLQGHIAGAQDAVAQAKAELAAIEAEEA